MKAYVVFFFSCFFFFIPGVGQAQLISVSGIVKNLSTGDVAQKVTVYESKSGIGTITNKQGYYRLLLHPGQREIEFSGTGFHPSKTRFELVADTVISIELVPADTQNVNIASADRIDPDE